MIRVERLSPEQFGSMSQQWTSLINNSTANPLFMGWAWQYTWWETWSASLELKLQLLGAYHNDALVGLLPLYMPKGANRLEFIGNAWRGADTVRTEYCSTIVDSNKSRSDVDGAFVEFILKNYRSVDIVLSDLINPSLIKAFEKNNRNALERENAIGAKVTTSTGDFGTYLSSLSASVRRKLYHRRNYFMQKNKVVLEKSWKTDSTSVIQFFTMLNRFHQVRWGKDCFQGPALNFHYSLIRKLNLQPDASVFLNVLYVDDFPVSVLYDIQLGTKVYNIQSGYIENYDSKVSLGILHLGFQIEKAFKNKSKKYDFLLGDGKNSFYKSTLTNELYYQKTYHVITHPAKKFVFFVYFNLPKRGRIIISSLRRFFKI